MHKYRQQLFSYSAYVRFWLAGLVYRQLYWSQLSFHWHSFFVLHYVGGRDYKIIQMGTILTCSTWWFNADCTSPPFQVPTTQHSNCWYRWECCDECDHTVRDCPWTFSMPRAWLVWQPFRQNSAPARPSSDDKRSGIVSPACLVVYAKAIISEDFFAGYGIFMLQSIHWWSIHILCMHRVGYVGISARSHWWSLCHVSGPILSPFVCCWMESRCYL